jgi:hypothetical protein
MLSTAWHAGAPIALGADEAWCWPLRNGWAAKAGAGRGKGAAGKETRYSLTIM